MAQYQALLVNNNQDTNVVQAPSQSAQAAHPPATASESQRTRNIQNEVLTPSQVAHASHPPATASESSRTRVTPNALPDNEKATKTNQSKARTAASKAENTHIHISSSSSAQNTRTGRVQSKTRLSIDNSDSKKHIRKQVETDRAFTAEKCDSDSDASQRIDDSDSDASQRIDDSDSESQPERKRHCTAIRLEHSMIACGRGNGLSVHSERNDAAKVDGDVKDTESTTSDGSVHKGKMMTTCGVKADRDVKGAELTTSNGSVHKREMIMCGAKADGVPSANNAGSDVPQTHALCSSQPRKNETGKGVMVRESIAGRQNMASCHACNDNYNARHACDDSAGKQNTATRHASYDSTDGEQQLLQQMMHQVNNLKEQKTDVLLQMEHHSTEGEQAPLSRLMAVKRTNAMMEIDQTQRRDCKDDESQRSAKHKRTESARNVDDSEVSGLECCTASVAGASVAVAGASVAVTGAHNHKLHIQPRTQSVEAKDYCSLAGAHRESSHSQAACDTPADSHQSKHGLAGEHEESLYSRAAYMATDEGPTQSIETKDQRSLAGECRASSHSQAACNIATETSDMYDIYFFVSALTELASGPSRPVDDCESEKASVAANVAATDVAVSHALDKANVAATDVIVRDKLAGVSGSASCLRAQTEQKRVGCVTAAVVPSGCVADKSAVFVLDKSAVVVLDERAVLVLDDKAVVGVYPRNDDVGASGSFKEVKKCDIYDTNNACSQQNAQRGTKTSSNVGCAFSNVATNAQTSCNVASVPLQSSLQSKEEEKDLRKSNIFISCSEKCNTNLASCSEKHDTSVASCSNKSDTSTVAYASFFNASNSTSKPVKIRRTPQARTASVQCTIGAERSNKLEFESLDSKSSNNCASVPCIMSTESSSYNRKNSDIRATQGHSDPVDLQQRAIKSESESNAINSSGNSESESNTINLHNDSNADSEHHASRAEQSSSVTTTGEPSAPRRLGRPPGRKNGARNAELAAKKVAEEVEEEMEVSRSSFGRKICANKKYVDELGSSSADLVPAPQPNSVVTVTVSHSGREIRQRRVIDSLIGRQCSVEK
jgi:hypothetical protein